MAKAALAAAYCALLPCPAPTHAAHREAGKVDTKHIKVRAPPWCCYCCRL